MHKPKYTDEPKGIMNMSAYMNTYYAHAGKAYSLHLTARNAKKYRGSDSDWWKISVCARKVFVSESTFEKISESKDKQIFVIERQDLYASMGGLIGLLFK